MNSKELGNAIRGKRLSLNMTMDFVANKTHITRSTLWKMENGKGNYSLNALLNVFEVLSLNLKIEKESKTLPKRQRATRINKIKDKRISRFIVFCVEHYCAFSNQNGFSVYKEMCNKGIIDYLENDYEDLHGMSFEYLNYFIDDLMR